MLRQAFPGLRQDEVSPQSGPHYGKRREKSGPLSVESQQTFVSPTPQPVQHQCGACREESSAQEIRGEPQDAFGDVEIVDEVQVALSDRARVEQHRPTSE